MAKRTQLLLVAVAVLFAGIASMLVMNVLKQAQKTSAVPTVSVVVAARRVGPHQVIGAADVTVRQMNPGSVPTGALTTVNQAVGQYSAGDWFAGEPVLGSMVVRSTDAAAFPLSIPSGDRAYTIPDDAVTGVDHLISPGDHVDVLVSYSPQSVGGKSKLQSQTVLQDVLVLYVDNTPDPSPVATATSSQGPSSSSESVSTGASTPAAGSSSSPSASSSSSLPSTSAAGGTGSMASTRTQTGDTITLALLPKDAQVLDLARSLGQIELLLRNPSDTSTENLAPTTSLAPTSNLP